MQITIRPTAVDDLASLLFYRSDPRFQKICPVKIQEFAVEEARLKNLLRDSGRREFTICLSLHPIGSGNIRPFKSDALEIGFEISPDYWGKGYATQLCQFLMEEASKLPQPQQIVGRCVAFNIGSQAVMHKAGMHLVEAEQLPNGIEFVTYLYTPTYH
jgi:RimJ/RimL family protein N-acetyltransferase